MAVQFEQLDLSGYAKINDTTPSASTTYSSQKIEEILPEAGAVIDDSEASTTKTYSSTHIDETYLKKDGNGSGVSVEYTASDTGSAPASGSMLGNLIGWLVGKCNGIGNISNLMTVAKSNLVAAINELSGKIGDLTQLDTTEKTDLVAAINEMYSEVKNQAADYIVESSMNPNGYWIKYNSGKMEVWGVSSFSTPISNTDTWLFYSDAVTVNFPVKFESIYSVQASSSNENGAWPCITGNWLTLSGFKAWLYCATQNTSPVSGQIMYHAFGTWK